MDIVLLNWQFSKLERVSKSSGGFVKAQILGPVLRAFGLVAVKWDLRICTSGSQACGCCWSRDPTLRTTALNWALMSVISFMLAISDEELYHNPSA